MISMKAISRQVNPPEISWYLTSLHVQVETVLMEIWFVVISGTSVTFAIFGLIYHIVASLFRSFECLHFRSFGIYMYHHSLSSFFSTFVLHFILHSIYSILPAPSLFILSDRGAEFYVYATKCTPLKPECVPIRITALPRNQNQPRLGLSVYDIYHISYTIMLLPISHGINWGVISNHSVLITVYGGIDGVYWRVFVPYGWILRGFG